MTLPGGSESGSSVFATVIVLIVSKSATEKSPLENKAACGTLSLFSSTNGELVEFAACPETFVVAHDVDEFMEYVVNTTARITHNIFLNSI